MISSQTSTTGFSDQSDLSDQSQSDQEDSGGSSHKTSMSTNGTMGEFLTEWQCQNVNCHLPHADRQEQVDEAAEVCFGYSSGDTYAKIEVDGVSFLSCDTCHGIFHKVCQIIDNLLPDPDALYM